MKFLNKDRQSLWLFGIAGLINVTQWIVAVTWPPTAVAPLHYTIYFGIDLTGPAWQMNILPSVGTAIILIHYLLSLLQKSTLWSRLWAVTAVAFLSVLATALATLRFVTTQ